MDVQTARGRYICKSIPMDGVMVLRLDFRRRIRFNIGVDVSCLLANASFGCGLALWVGWSWGLFGLFPIGLGMLHNAWALWWQIKLYRALRWRT